jgi:hypothetical protein
MDARILFVCPILFVILVAQGAFIGLLFSFFDNPTFEHSNNRLFNPLEDLQWSVAKFEFAKGAMVQFADKRPTINDAQRFIKVAAYFITQPNGESILRHETSDFDIRPSSIYVNFSIIALSPSFSNSNTTCRVALRRNTNLLQQGRRSIREVTFESKIISNISSGREDTDVYFTGPSRLLTVSDFYKVSFDCKAVGPARLEYMVRYQTPSYDFWDESVIKKTCLSNCIWSQQEKDWKYILITATNKTAAMKIYGRFTYPTQLEYDNWLFACAFISLVVSLVIYSTSQKRVLIAAQKA